MIGLKSTQMKAWIICLGFAFFSYAGPARAEVSSAYGAMLQALVYTGVSDAGTINHNLKVYQLLLKRVEQNAALDARRLGKGTAIRMQKEMVNRLNDLQVRLKAQLAYVPESYVADLMGGIWTHIDETRRAALEFNFPKVRAQAASAIVELERCEVK